jgi:hypothetical protein
VPKPHHLVVSALDRFSQDTGAAPVQHGPNWVLQVT